jgi:hypothetical protein
MAQPSKEAQLALRTFLVSRAGQEIISHLRSDPPTTKLDPAIHVYSHSCGVRDGWQRCVEYLAEMQPDKPEGNIRRDTLD